MSLSEVIFNFLQNLRLVEFLGALIYDFMLTCMLNCYNIASVIVNNISSAKYLTIYDLMYSNVVEIYVDKFIICVHHILYICDYHISYFHTSFTNPRWQAVLLTLTSLTTCSVADCERQHTNHKVLASTGNNTSFISLVNSTNDQAKNAFLSSSKKSSKTRQGQSSKSIDGQTRETKTGSNNHIQYRAISKLQG